MEVDKIEAFDYMLQLFEEWRDNHETIKGKPFPKLTAMKLLFLAAAPKKDGGDDLLDIFDNFYAVPYGPVESDVYNAMCEDKLPSFSVKYRSIEPREGADFPTFILNLIFHINTSFPFCLPTCIDKL